MSTEPIRRVVCAALRCDDIIITGARHFDSIMSNLITRIFPIEVYSKLVWEQGFIDQFGQFLTREEAYIIAVEANQIVRDCISSDHQRLYSEHLY